MAVEIDKSTHRKLFWDDWSSKAQESGQYVRFMLGIDNLEEANVIGAEDVREIIGLLPDLSGMDVLELASGVGRFTPDLAKRAKHVISTDFNDTFVQENKRVNGPLHQNVTFRTLDATKLDYPPNSFDLIFFTWLLAYLSDEEIRKCAETFLRMLRPGGMMFFRETHFTCACSCDTTNNAGQYRSIKEFRSLFKPAQYTCPDGTLYRFDHSFSVNSKTYIKYKKMPTLINYLWKKTESTGNDQDIQWETDASLYNDDCMLVYNNVIGDGFCSPGGMEATKEWLSCFTLEPESTMLDVGCGTGGLHSLLLQEYNADVTGIDISMLACQETILRSVELEKVKGCVKISNLSTTTFPDNSFEYILVKDTLEYLTTDMRDLLLKFQEWLSSNGQLLIGSCFRTSSSGTESTVFSQVHGFNPLTKDQFLEALTISGLCVTQSKDLTRSFIGFFEANIQKLATLEGISSDTKTMFTNWWEAIATGLKRGELQWLAMSAKKMKN